MSLRASFVELWSRAIDFVKSDQIYTNGNDNKYSESMERVVMNSATANRVRSIYAKYIEGYGLDMDIDLPNDRMLSDVVRDISMDLSLQNGSWIHRQVKLDLSGSKPKFTTKDLKVLNYHKCRKGKDDDEDNESKIHYGTFSGKGWLKDKTKSKNSWYYPFTNDDGIIAEQIFSDAAEHDVITDDITEAIKYYRGQVYYINMTPSFVYAISPFDSVFNDCDTEFRMSLYTNKAFREGFLGKLMVLFSNLDPDYEKDFKDDIKAWLGAENSSGIYIGKVDDAEEIGKNIYIKQLESQYDDDMAVNTEERIRRNILGAGQNVPEGLLFSNEGGMFSSGEQIEQLKLLYEENTSAERKVVERTLKRLGFNIKIKTLGDGIEEQSTETE